MTKVTIVKELTGFTGHACLVKRRDKFFVVSSTSALGTPETLVFPADAKGNVTSWGEVAGGRYMSRQEAINDLATRDFRKSRNW